MVSDISNRRNEENMSEKAYLVLENGTVFEGKSFGADRTSSGDSFTTGEVVFTTAMTGYLETLTDPSYYGQIVVQTFPLIGNYGVIPADFESKKPAVKGYIVREWCQEPSNFRENGRLDTFLKEHGIIAMCGIDTRRLTKIVRESGVMNGRIYIGLLPENATDGLSDYTIVNAVNSVSCTEAAEYYAENGFCKVVLMDFGAKDNIRRELVKRGCNVTVVPANTTAQGIIDMKPDGIMLSNGPGDPSENIGIIAELKKLSASGIPMFGICLGHQLLALAHGAKTVKLKYGHRGANQPATDTQTGRVYITSQNHGYAVLSSTLPPDARASFINANDDTCEGVQYNKSPAFSVQFHPEACGGPHDTSFLFDKFIQNIKEAMNDAVK